MPAKPEDHRIPQFGVGRRANSATHAIEVELIRFISSTCRSIVCVAACANDHISRRVASDRTQLTTQSTNRT